MATLKVTSEELHSVSGQLRSASDEISNRLSSAHAQVQGLVDASWQGAASSSFGELYQQWNTSAAQLRQALDGIAQQLGSAARTYEDTESHLASQF
jgi:WXG100 family type VII secretion target